MSDGKEEFHAGIQANLTSDGAQFFRLIISDVSLFPDMAATFYAVGPGRAVAAITRGRARRPRSPNPRCQNSPAHRLQ